MSPFKSYFFITNVIFKIVGIVDVWHLYTVETFEKCREVNKMTFDYKQFYPLYFAKQFKLIRLHRKVELKRKKTLYHGSIYCEAKLSNLWSVGKHITFSL